MKYADEFKRITEDVAAHKERRSTLLAQEQADSVANKRISDAVQILNSGSADITEWDESVIRQLVDTVKVLSADKILVYLRGGREVEQTIEKG